MNCASGHQMAEGEEVMASGLCYLCGVLSLQVPSENVTIEHEKCPRCDQPLPFQGVHTEGMNLMEAGKTTYRVVARYGACTNHANDDKSVDANQLRDSFARGTAI